jgi:D-alanine-D-alanine ligase
VTLKEAREFFRGKKILVLGGGWSREREVSLRSARRVYDSLLRQGFRASFLDVDRNFLEDIKSIKPDLVVIMLHGKPGEDGSIQGALEALGIPYTGTGVLGSALGMNKLQSKRIFESLGIPTPRYVYVNSSYDLPVLAKRAKRELGLPLVVKPKDEGSSIGVTIVREESELEQVLESERREFGDLLIEEYIEGKSVTVGVLGTGLESFPLPILELRVKGREFYDYVAKYTKGVTEFVIPAEISEEATSDLQRFALMAHRALECRGFSRVDAVVDGGGRPFILEVNTIPGMTELSDLPAEAEAMGISYDEVVLWILKSAYESP